MKASPPILALLLVLSFLCGCQEDREEVLERNPIELVERSMMEIRSYGFELEFSQGGRNLEITGEISRELGMAHLVGSDGTEVYFDRGIAYVKRGDSWEFLSGLDLPDYLWIYSLIVRNLENIRELGDEESLGCKKYYGEISFEKYPGIFGDIPQNPFLFAPPPGDMDVNVCLSEDGVPKVLEMTSEGVGGATCSVTPGPESEGCSISEGFSVVIRFNRFNEIESIDIPEEVKKSARPRVG